MTRLLAAALFAALALPASAQEEAKPLVLRATGLGKVGPNASGRARLMAKRAARLDALRKLTAAIHGMVQGADGTKWTQGVIRGFKVVEEKELPGGTGYQVTVELPISAMASNFQMEFARAAKLAAALAEAKKKISMLEAQNADLKAKLEKASMALEVLTERYDNLIAALRKLVPAK